MRVYTKCVHIWDESTSQYVLDESESEFTEDYSGEVAQCGRGGGDAPEPDPQIGKSALENVQLGNDWLVFAKDQFAQANTRQATLDQLTNKVTASQLATQDKNNLRADQQWEQQQETFKPIEQKIASEAMNYDTPERQAQMAAEAKADVIGNAEMARKSKERNMASMGVNPMSGRYTAVSDATQLNTALAAAGAENKARENVRGMGIMLRKDAASLGRNMTGTAAQAYGIGTQAGNSASANQLANQQAFNANSNVMNQGFQGNIGANTQAAGTLNNLYGNQLQGYQAQQQADADGMAGIGSLVGTLGAAAITKSSKKIKENKRKYDGALDAINKMPVERWKYKKGVADEGEHIGAYAEDFKKQTGVGDGKTINVIDALGVAMKAVQELNKKVDDQIKAKRNKP